MIDVVPAFEWHDQVLIDPPPGPPTPGTTYPDLTIMVPEPTEALAGLPGHYTRRNLTSGDESYTTVFGSASRAETIGITNGDATITGAAGTFEEWDPGAPITGIGIPAGTTILSVTSDTSAEMSANATNTNSSLAAAIGLHGIYVSALSAGEGYLTPCPSGDFEVIVLHSRTIPISDRMIGPWIVDSATGHGVLSSWYSSPQSWLTLRSTGWAYTGGFTQGSTLNMPQATTALKLRKSGTNYYTSYSLDYGATWSAETPAQAWTGTPTHMGFGCILGANQSTKFHEFYPGPTEPEDEPEIPGEDPPPYLEWQANEALTSALKSYSVETGRSGINEKVQPAQASIVLGAQRAGDCPPIGHRFRLTLADALADELGFADAADAARFTGEITDVVIEPERGTYAITAVGRLGRARRRPVDGSGWPIEDDGNRVARILAAAAPDADVDVDPGTADLIPPPEPAPAGQLLDLVADSTLGQVVEQPSGVLEWHDGDHRRGAVPVLDLDASQIDSAIRWAQSVGDVINEVTVAYGVSNATALSRDPASIFVREAYPQSLTTALVDASAAHSLGSLLVGRRSEPIWQLPVLLVDLTTSRVDDALLALLLALAHGDRITLTGLPAGPYPAEQDVYVEGVTEAAAYFGGGVYAWTRAFAVADPQLSGVAVRVMDAPGDLLIEDVEPTLTVLACARIEDPEELRA